MSQDDTQLALKQEMSGKIKGLVDTFNQLLPEAAKLGLEVDLKVNKHEVSQSPIGVDLSVTISERITY